MTGSEDRSLIDPIQLEVIVEGLVSIVREMREAVFRTAHSPVISEAQDFSCALFNPQGEMIAQSRDMPGHVVAMPASVAEIMADFGNTLAPGDILISNDPYRGGSHLNDVTVVTPVFVKDEPFVFPCVRMHWADIGGMTPGSISGSATEILQEGVRIPPIKLVDAGVWNEAARTLLFSNVRGAEARRGDLDANIAACRTAERRLREFADRYGTEEILRHTAHNLDRTEARMRHQIDGLPDGTYCYEDSLDLFTDGHYDPALVRCELTVEGDEITANFDGSSPQVDAVANASRAMTEAGVFIVLKSALDPGGQINAGAFRPIHVKTPTDSVVAVGNPAPANAHSEVRKRVLSAVMGALAQIAPEAVTADQCGSTFQNLLGGVDQASGVSYLYYDYPPGGNGGFPEADGPSAMNPVDLGDISTVQPVERLESTTPVLVEECSFRTNSAGPGAQRGGFAARRSTQLLASHGTYSVQADRTVVPPYGLNGGGWGAPARTHVVQEGDALDFATPGKVSGVVLKAGDTLVMEAAGGGGWGDPLARDPDLVASEVVAGLLSIDIAATTYGVVLNDDGAVDLAKTTQRRLEIGSRRTTMRLVEIPECRAFTGRRGRHRRIELSLSAIQTLSLKHGDLIELRGRHPAPLRGWLYKGHQSAGRVGVSTSGRAILGVEWDEEIEIARIPTTISVT